MKPELTNFEEGLASTWARSRWSEGKVGRLIALSGIAVFICTALFFIQYEDDPLFWFKIFLSGFTTLVWVAFLAVIRIEWFKKRRSCYKYVYETISSIINDPSRRKADMPEMEELRERKRALYNYLESTGSKSRTSEGPKVPEEDDDFPNDRLPTPAHEEAERILVG